MCPQGSHGPVFLQVPVQERGVLLRPEQNLLVLPGGPGARRQRAPQGLHRRRARDRPRRGGLLPADPAQLRPRPQIHHHLVHVVQSVCRLRREAGRDPEGQEERASVHLLRAALRVGGA